LKEQSVKFDDPGNFMPKFTSWPDFQLVHRHLPIDVPLFQLVLVETSMIFFIKKIFHFARPPQLPNSSEKAA
jgi:hypothetical protein